MWLRVIAVLKFVNAVLLIGLSVGAFRLLHRDLGDVLEHWVRALRLAPGNRFVDAALEKASLVTPAQIKKVGLGGLIYAGFFLAEGTGLWRRKRWGEWLTVVITSTLVPVEIWETYRHPTALKVVALVLNVGIVAYLIWRIRRESGSKSVS